MLSSLSTASKLQVVKLRGDSPYLILITVDFGGGNIFHIVDNNEDITFRGITFYHWNFTLGDLTDDGKQLAKLPLKVDNVMQVPQRIVEQFNGGVSGLVHLYVVNYANIASGIADLEEEFVVQDTTCEDRWITFNLGADFHLRSRYPKKRIMKNHCTHTYGDIECAVPSSTISTFPTCNRTLSACRERGNSTRYGSEPGIPQGGLYV